MPLTITLLQPDIIWENIAANLTAYDTYLENIQRTDIVILPEMFSTGFSMNPAPIAEPEGGKTMNWMAQWANRLDAAVVGSLMIADKGRYYNRLIFMLPNGSYTTYDKRHLFRMGGEHLVYTAGQTRTLVTYKNWKIAPLICYDLRFPVWSRRDIGEYSYDLLIYTANWPQARIEIWKQLLIARAIENQSYVLGVNRVGTDGNGVYHDGCSMVIDPKGNILWTQKDQIALQTIQLDKKELDTFRESFPAWADADTFQITT